jgi:hypothetical protein
VSGERGEGGAREKIVSDAMLKYWLQTQKLREILCEIV